VTVNCRGLGIAPTGTGGRAGAHDVSAKKVRASIVLKMLFLFSNIISIKVADRSIILSVFLTMETPQILKDSATESTPELNNLQQTEFLINGEPWPIALFNKSVLKQAKFKQLSVALGQEISGRRCFDLGSDNGVISLLLRRIGGDWHSADLTTQSVESIQSLVGTNVTKIDGQTFPFPDNYFDSVVIVDMLEHVENDEIFVQELYRIMRSGGQLIINAPNMKNYSLLKMVRNMIGQTDEAHGHLRPGYGVLELRTLLSTKFKIENSKTYSRFFSEAIDTLIVAGYGLISGKTPEPTDKPSEEVSKGLVITESELKKFQKKFKIFSLIYPVLKLASYLDYLIFFLPGYMRITTARVLK
jgi:2-polyprenyl-3-methyl-5-hydroxy-6-metoxy-1,4-benzoquinol methylase